VSWRPPLVGTPYDRPTTAHQKKATTEGTESDKEKMNYSLPS
jgi:hypothetical protein